MDTLDAIRERRAVKHFDATHQFTAAETDALIDLAMQPHRLSIFSIGA
jgi:hypothetical protein